MWEELKQRIGPLDPRWTAFGLNKPGAPSTPAVPQNVTAVSCGPGQMLASCDATPRATHYRFFTQENELEAELVFAGSSSTPSLVIGELQGGHSYSVYVSAADEAGQSPLSQPAVVTPIELLKAA
ncbi:MAG: fibronectin type III domain-containing protein [Pedosphaera sp.]|nr:fibronectin type III domain-containing protein [Pedosphaera sp.]